MKTTQEDRVNNTEYIMMSDNQFAFFFFSFIHYLYALRFLSAYAWATQMNLQTMPIKIKNSIERVRDSVTYFMSLRDGFGCMYDDILLCECYLDWLHYLCVCMCVT